MIVENKFIAASNTSVKEEEIREVWMIEKNNRDKILSNEIYCKDWKRNTNELVEVIIMLDLV